MNEALEELRRLMEEHDIPAARAVRLIGCSRPTFYNWLSGRFAPSPIYTTLIRRAIRKLQVELGLRAATQEVERYVKEIGVDRLRKLAEAQRKKK